MEQFGTCESAAITFEVGIGAIEAARGLFEPEQPETSPLATANGKTTRNRAFFISTPLRTGTLPKMTQGVNLIYGLYWSHVRSDLSDTSPKRSPQKTINLSLKSLRFHNAAVH